MPTVLDLLGKAARLKEISPIDGTSIAGRVEDGATEGNTGQCEGSEGAGRRVTAGTTE